jgi:hypothetical protein
MNISTSTFRLQLIVCHSTFLTVLIEKDNQSLQPENMFSRKRFHTQLQKHLLAHRYSNQLRTAFRTRARLVCHLVNVLLSIITQIVIEKKRTRTRLFLDLLEQADKYSPYNRILCLNLDQEKLFLHKDYYCWYWEQEV